MQIERAHKILRVLRGPRWNVTKELTDIKVALEGRETYNVRLRDFASATVWKPFLIALSLMFFFQFSGINVILHYTVDIFQSADSSVEEFQVKYFWHCVWDVYLINRWKIQGSTYCYETNKLFQYSTDCKLHFSRISRCPFSCTLQIIIC